MSSIRISKVTDISKLFAFIKVNANGKFVVQKEVLEELFRQAEDFARNHNVSLELISPSGERVAVFTATGAVLGAGLGFYVAGIPGVLIGGAVGAIAGYACAHVTIVIEPSPDGDLIHLHV